MAESKRRKEILLGIFKLLIAALFIHDTLGAKAQDRKRFSGLTKGSGFHWFSPSRFLDSCHPGEGYGVAQSPSISFYGGANMGARIEYSTGAQERQKPGEWTRKGD